MSTTGKKTKHTFVEPQTFELPHKKRSYIEKLSKSGLTEVN